MLCIEYKKKWLTEFLGENKLATKGDTAVDSNSSAAIDLQRLEAIYRQYVGCVYRLCLQLLNDVADAEEATVQVFVRLNRELAKAENESQIHHRLNRLIIKEASSKLRKRTGENG